jgi:hypothetical protein
VSNNSRTAAVDVAKTELTVVLAFAVCGGLAFEALRIVPEMWSSAVTMFNRLLA